MQRQVIRASEYGLYARQQFLRVERLRDVVIGAHFESDDTIRVRSQQSEHDHRHSTVAPEIAAKRQAVFAWHNAIEHHQVNFRFAELAFHIAAIGGHIDSHSILAQKAR